MIIQGNIQTPISFLNNPTLILTYADKHFANIILLGYYLEGVS